MALLQQSPYIEIQSLNERLDASQKKIDRYAHLIATLSDELDNLRNNICHACKKKLGSRNVSVPEAVAAPSSASPLASTSLRHRVHQFHQSHSRSLVIDVPRGSPSNLPAITSFISSENINFFLLHSPGPAVAVGLTSVPKRRRTLQGRQHQSRSRSLVIETPRTNFPAITNSIPSQNIIPSLLLPPGPVGLASGPTTDVPVGISPAINPDSSGGTVIRESEPPEWSVVYNPDVKQVLDIHVARVFTHESQVFCAKISCDGQKLAIGLEDDGKTYIIEVKTGSDICILVDLYIKDPLSIFSLQFSPNGQLVATAASDHRIRIWDIAQKRVRAMFNGHTSMINSIAFAPNGRFLVSASDDRTVRIWNIRDGASKKLTDFRIFIPVTFSSSGGYFAACTYHGSLKIWDARSHKLVTKWDGLSGSPWCLEFTPDGKGLMIEGANYTLEYWDVSPLGIIRTQRRKELEVPADSFRRMRCFSGHTDTVRSIAFFPDNDQWVLTCADDQSARLWDTQSGVCQFTLRGHTGPVYAVDFSPTENLLLTASGKHVTLWTYRVH